MTCDITRRKLIIVTETELTHPSLGQQLRDGRTESPRAYPCYNLALDHLIDNPSIPEPKVGWTS